MWYFIVGGVALLGVKSYFDGLKEKKELEEEKSRKRTHIESLFPLVKMANEDFIKLIERNAHYFAYIKLIKWKRKHKQILSQNVCKDDFENIDLKNLTILNEFNNFIKITNDLLGIRKNYNLNFLNRELEKTKELLSDIDGKSLDTQQRKAIIKDEDNSLIIAGAGCGKTTTIMGKVTYLCSRLNVLPSEILLISFTRKSANDLAEKVNIEGVEAKTFHKLGLDIIKEVENGKPSTFDQSLDNFIRKSFQKRITTEDYLSKVVRYFTDYIRIEKKSFDINNQAEHIKHLKEQNFRPYKKRKFNLNGKETYLREIVKSQEECKIANFLLFNSVKYEYELAFEVNLKTLEYRQYKPDFTLFQNGIKVYLEHYGIDRKGNVPPFFANESTTLEEARIRYHEGISWKRNVHEKYNTNYIETFHYEFSEGNLYKKLIDSLLVHGFEIKPLSEKEKWDIINKSASDEVEALIRLFSTFLTLYKSNNLTFDDLKEKVNNLRGFNKERTIAFVNIFLPIFNDYQLMLKRREEIDFSDMINLATKYTKERKYNSNYKYIIVDEYQDISIGRYKLLKAFKEQNEELKLFAVGDDFQSIYRFTGSDITLFNKFEKYFGYTESSIIETTYRFGEPLIEKSGEFIMKNPSQIKKQLKTKLNIKTDIEVVYSEDEKDDTQILIKSLNQIIKDEIKNGLDKHKSLDEIYQSLKDKKYYILGRYNFDIKRVNTADPSLIKINEDSFKYIYDGKLSIVLEFYTVHRSKGLEADFIFIIGLRSGKVGFPSGMIDDPVLLLLLGDSEIFPNSEERRVFYVALTRAKKKVVCISSKQFTSSFVSEIDDKVNKGVKCPRCKVGDLKLTKGVTRGKEWAFYGCSNFSLYECNYKLWVNE